MKKFLLGCTALMFAAAPAFGQMADMQHTTTQIAQPTAPAVERIEVNQDGTLTGKVYANVAGAQTPVDAKVTLASKGVVIEAVQTENGSFSFANIAPGSYTITGATPGFAGGQTYQVAPYAGTGCSCSVGLQSTSAPIYQSSPVYNAPVSSFQSGGIVSTPGIVSNQTVVSSGIGGGGIGGGGFGGGGGIGGGGFGGRGLFGGGLRNRRLLRAGLIGGVVAIAVSDDDDDDVSADQ